MSLLQIRFLFNPATPRINTLLTHWRDSSRQPESTRSSSHRPLPYLSFRSSCQRARLWLFNCFFLSLKYTSSDLLTENVDCFSLPLLPVPALDQQTPPRVTQVLIWFSYSPDTWDSSLLAEPVPWVLLPEGLTQYVWGWAIGVTFSTSSWSLECSFSGNCDINHQPKPYWLFDISGTPMSTYPSPMMFQCSSHCRPSGCLSQNHVGK